MRAQCGPGIWPPSSRLDVFPFNTWRFPGLAEYTPKLRHRWNAPVVESGKIVEGGWVRLVSTGFVFLKDLRFGSTFQCMVLQLFCSRQGNRAIDTVLVRVILAECMQQYRLCRQLVPAVQAESRLLDLSSRINVVLTAFPRDINFIRKETSPRSKHSLPRPTRSIVSTLLLLHTSPFHSVT